MVTCAPVIAPFLTCFIEPTKQHVGFLVYSGTKVRDKDRKMKQLNEKKQIVKDKQDRATRNTALQPKLAGSWVKDVEKVDEKSKSIKKTGWQNIIKRYKAGRYSHKILKDIKDLEERSSNIEFPPEKIPLAEVGLSTRASTSTPLPLDTQNNFQQSTPPLPSLGIPDNIQPSTSAPLPLDTQNNFQQSTPPLPSLGIPENVQPSTSAPLPLDTQNNFQQSTSPLPSLGIPENVQPSTSAPLPLDNQNNFQQSTSPLPSLGIPENIQPSTSAPLPLDTRIEFESRRLVYNDVWKSLQSNIKMIALCGMGGVGKTMMMEDLKKAVEDSGLFDYVVKVDLSEHTNIDSLQQAIAEYFDVELSEKSKSARADRLRLTFEARSVESKKKTLVIMDDVRKQIELKDVGLSPLPNEIKILFTSRHEDVCKRMGVEATSIFNVCVLNDEEAKNLFFRKVGQYDPAQLQNTGEKIVMKCGGLPRALVLIADSLRGRAKGTWEEICTNLEQDDLNDLNHDLEDNVHKLFEETYANLKRNDDKALFLLSGLYPQDFDIPIEDLMMYSWGLKLFSPGVATLVDARRRATTCVDNLKHANMLIGSKVYGCIKMHNLFRAFALNHCPKVKQASIVYSDVDDIAERHKVKYANEPYKRILLKCTNISQFPACFSDPDLSLLILMAERSRVKFPNSFHKTRSKLQVVSYKDLGCPLPFEEFTYLTQLRTLCLHSCILEGDISVLEGLCSLEALRFASCTLGRLPSQIGNLEKLKLLDVSGCVVGIIDDDVFQKLKSLKELYMMRLRDSDGSRITFTNENLLGLEEVSKKLSALELEIHENKPEPKKVIFEKLERFRISIDCELEDKERHLFRNTLCISTDQHKIQECKIGELFKKTVELKLQVIDMKHLKDVSNCHPFSELRTLHVSRCEELEYLFTVSVAKSMAKLEELFIEECPQLTSLVGENSQNESITFEKFSLLSLKNLPQMVRLWDTRLEFLGTLKLKINGVPLLEGIYPTYNTGNIDVELEGGNS